MVYMVEIVATKGTYRIKCNESVASEFRDFVDGVDKKQFYTFHSGDNFSMVSRKAIEYVIFSVVEED